MILHHKFVPYSWFKSLSIPLRAGCRMAAVSDSRVKAAVYPRLTESGIPKMGFPLILVTHDDECLCWLLCILPLKTDSYTVALFITVQG